MTTIGLLFMILSWTGIIGLTIFCFKRTLSEKEEKIIGPLEVEAQMDAEENSKQ